MNNKYDLGDCAVRITNGESVQSIAKDKGCHSSLIYQYLKKHNIILNKSYLYSFFLFHFSYFSSFRI
jgi:hypothetical protein